MMSRTPRRRLRLALLRAFARLTPSPALEPVGRGPADARPPRPRRILVLRPDHIGDVLFITPALRVLRRRYPNAHITGLVGPWGASVLANNPHLDELKTLRFPGFSRQPKPSLWQPYGLLWGWARRLREQYDLAYILRFDHWWGALLAYLAGVPWRVGYAVSEVTPFLSHALPYLGGRHEVEQNLRLINEDLKDGGSPEEPSSTDLAESASPVHHPLEFHIPQHAVSWARRIWPASHPIVIHPGAGAAVKLWKATGWAAVADTLAQEPGTPIVLTGSEDERPLCIEIAAHMESSAQVMAGETDLDRLAALFSWSRGVLGVDSGPLHLAVAVGTPTVHLYGPVDTAAFGPWGPAERHRVITSAWPCIPCNRLDYRPDEIEYHPCVREIGASAVLTAARQAFS